MLQENVSTSHQQHHEDRELLALKGTPRKWRKQINTQNKNQKQAMYLETTSLTRIHDKGRSQSNNKKSEPPKRKRKPFREEATTQETGDKCSVSSDHPEIPHAVTGRAKVEETQCWSCLAQGWGHLIEQTLILGPQRALKDISLPATAILFLDIYPGEKNKPGLICECRQLLCL